MKTAAWIRALAPACALVAQLPLACRAFAQDVYVGTLEYRQQRLVLRRCDLSQTVYLLRDVAPRPAGAVTRFTADHPERQGHWYAEVIGTYKNERGRHALEVSDLQNVQAGKSCHLSDALRPEGNRDKR